jgi:putative ABC transport system permease protein
MRSVLKGMAPYFDELVAAFRRLVRTPLIPSVVIVSVTLAVAANATVFSLLKSVLLRPLPFSEPNSLVAVSHVEKSGALSTVSYLDFAYWSEHTVGVFSGLVAIRVRGVDLLDPAPERVRIAQVTPEFFNVLGVRPLRGRTLQVRDGEPDADDVAVLTEGFWRSRFSADPNILGKRLRVNFLKTTRSYRVIGVIPSEVRLHQLPSYTFYVAEPRISREIRSWLDAPFLVIARLRSSVAIATARGRMDELVDETTRAHPARTPPAGAAVTALHEAEFGRTKPMFRLLLLTLAFVLFSVMLNLAGLLSADVATRSREFAIRVSVGATRSALFRQVFIEHGLATAFGILLSLTVGVAIARIMIARVPSDTPRLDDVVVDQTVILATLGVTAASVMVAALIPALKNSSDNSWNLLRTGGDEARRQNHRVDKIVVSLQFCATVALLLNAIIAARTFLGISRLDPGIDASDVLAVGINVPPSSWQNAARHLTLLKDISERSISLPGVVDAAFSGHLPPTSGAKVHLRLADGSKISPLYRICSPSYFSVLNVPVIAGRVIGENEAATAVVVNEAFAKAYLGSTAVGSGMWFGENRRHIVGVVGDVRERRLLTPAEPTVYTGFEQGRIPAEVWLLLKSRLPAQVVAASATRMVRSADPDASIRIVLLSEHLKQPASVSSFYASVLSFFAVFAGMMSVVSLWATLKRSVENRRHEIAVRMALGASPAAIRWGITGRLMLLVALSSLMGAWLGRIGGAFLVNSLEGVRGADVWTVALAIAFVTGPSLLAAYPSLKAATSGDVGTALRSL